MQRTNWHIRTTRTFARQQRLAAKLPVEMGRTRAPIRRTTRGADVLLVVVGVACLWCIGVGFAQTLLWAERMARG